MTTFLTQDPESGEHEPTPPPPAVELPTFDSAIAILALGTLLAIGGYFLPTGIRWIMWPLAMTVPGHAIVSATFGDHLDFGGFRRAGLSAALTLLSYPLIALTALVLGFALTAPVVSIGTFVLCAGCAAIIRRRERRPLNQSDLPPAPTGQRIQVGELIIPFGSITLAMLIALASLQLFPRAEPEEFNAIALDGTWALTARAVPANPSRDVEVAFRVENRTTAVQSYEVTAGIVDGPEWTGNVMTLEPGEIWSGTTRGQVLEDSCRSRLEIDMNVIDDPEDHFPLALFFRDSTLEC